MKTDFRHPARVAFVTGFLVAVAAAAGPALGEDWKASSLLHCEHLEEAGLHFVPDMWTIRLLFDHQDNLTTHQEFVVEWDSIPGQTKIMRYDDAERISASPKFVLKERKQNMPGGIGRKEDTAVRSVVIVAIDGSRQVLGIWVTTDPRLIYGESAGLLIEPNVTFRFWMPDDERIKSIIIFRTIPRAEGGAKLLEVGAIDLARNRP